MSYQITVQSQGNKQVEIVEGVKELRTTLALYRSQGWKITRVSRFRPVVQLEQA